MTHRNWWSSTKDDFTSQGTFDKVRKHFLCLSFSCLSIKYKFLFHNSKFEKIEEIFFLVMRILDLLS